MNQAVWVSLSLIGLVAIVGAGVGVGSGERRAGLPPGRGRAMGSFVLQAPASN